MGTVAVIPAAGLLAGAAIGLFLPNIPLAIGIVILAVGVAAALWSWRLSRPHWLAISVGFSFLVGGAMLAIDAWRAAWRPSLREAFEELAGEERRRAASAGRTLPEDDTAFALITGVLRADASRRANGVSLSLDVTSVGRPALTGRRAALSGPPDPDIPVRGGVLLSVNGMLALERIEEWRAGRTIRAPAQLRRPARYLNPGVPDEERSLARRGTTLVGSVKSGALIEMVERGRWWDEAAAEARRITRRAVERSVAPRSRRSAGIVTAILIGDRAGLDEVVERRLQDAGTYHVIAISGGNIAILAGLALAAFRLAGCLGRTAMLSAIAALLSYGYVVGGSASVSRATLMAVIYFAARAIDLRGPPISVLASCAGLLVAARPLDILDPGFLLTFGATFAILLAVPAWPSRTVPSSLAPLASMLAATIAAEAMLLPISALFFSRVTFAGLVLNFAAIPLMGIVQVAGLATVCAAAFSATLASMAGWIAHIAAEGLVRSADLVEVVPLPAWRVSAPAWPVVAWYYAALAAAWTLWRVQDRRPILQKARWAALVLSLTAAVWIAARPWLPFSHSARGRLRITFIDVGQGDSALVQFPRGDRMLVDAGGLGATSFDIGDRVVAPVLRHAGIRRLDTLMVTHGDLDHAGGAPSIVREFRPRDVWEGIPVPPLAVLRDLRSATGTSGGRWVNVQAGDLVAIGEVGVLVRHPRLADWERQDVRNDDSIVVELLWKDVSVVLTGDIGRDAEREMAASFPPSPIRVVKVAHHGSLTSSSREFVRALAPKVAVISVGRGNAFGHPAPAVLAAYRDAGAHIFRTDQDGAITVETDGHVLDVRTFAGRRLLVR